MSKQLTMGNLRNDLWTDFQRVRDKKLDAKTANATANLAGKIISTVRLDLLYCEMRQEKPNNKLLNA